MNTRTERHDLPDGFVEQSTITHEGREFSAGGAYVTDDAIIVYPMNDGIVTNWGSERLGTYRVTGYACGFYGTKLTCYRVRLDDGREYVGRGLGAGLILRARRAKATR